jgi:PadR family transcriptional regulator PadR
MEGSRHTSDLLRGHIDTILLKLLLDGDKYGYELTKLVFEGSGRTFELKEATMYSSLKRLEQEGSIQTYWGNETQGGRRKYCRITAKGRAAYKAKKKDWDYASKILDRLL